MSDILEVGECDHVPCEHALRMTPKGFAGIQFARVRCVVDDFDAVVPCPRLHLFVPVHI